MQTESLGLVVSGESDKAALTQLVRKYSPEARVKALTTNGPCRRKLVQRLKILQYDGEPYDTVLVIDDSDDKNPEAVRSDLQNVVGNITFRFPIHYIVVKQELETWLLADEEALTSASVSLGGAPISRINHELEDVRDAKELLIRELNAAGVSAYVPEVARRIANAIRTDQILYRCPHYQQFDHILRDC